MPPPADEGFRLFPTTHWSLVARAGQTDAAQAQRDALDALLRRYLPAFRSFLIARYRIPRDKADDWVQGFVASRLVEKNLIGKAEASRGKFRNFLMTALGRYAIDQLREESAQKRQGDRRHADVQDQQDQLAGAANEDPAAAFDASWATRVVAQAIEQMRQATSATRPELWAVFHDRVIGPAFDGSNPSSYAQLIGRLGFKDEGQAANTLHTAKRIFARVLRGIVAEYALTAEDVDQEIAELMQALGS
jgi:RNA polymerase sigma-70 factor (ECF subfamily)